MRTISLFLTALFLAAASTSGGIAQPTQATSNTALYANSGDNTTGFKLIYGSASFSSSEGVIVGDCGAGWVSLPVWVTGDFQIDFDVYPDANDAASFFLLYDDASHKGIEILNCTETSFGNHNIGVYSVDDLTDHDQFYFPQSPLATAGAKHFTNQAWTHVTIIKKGLTMTDNVGGQVITADLAKAKGNLPYSMRVGLGYNATTNVGGNGQIGYAHLRIVRVNAN